MVRVASRQQGWKPAYALIWTNAAAARLALEVGPRLRVKSKQARELVHFQNHVRQCRRRRDPRGRLLPLSPWQLGTREAFYKRLKSLNQRGPNPRSRSAGSVNRGSGKISAEYAAGFIDAEGSVILARVKVFEKWNAQYVPRVCVDNTNRAVLEEIQRDYGGTLTNQPARKVHWKPGHKLIWNGHKVEPLLLAVGPYLRIKRKQARILMRFIGHRKKTRQGRAGRGFARLPRREIAYRDALYMRMKRLNRRGS